MGSALVQKFSLYEGWLSACCSRNRFSNLYWIRSSTIGTLVKKYLGKLKSKKKEKEIKKAECKKNETKK
jgi:hypothetical protein